ncbi:MAG: family 43 glycosylhydrolase [Pseudomonadota bacterium]
MKTQFTWLMMCMVLALTACNDSSVTDINNASSDTNANPVVLSLCNDALDDTVNTKPVSSGACSQTADTDCETSHFIGGAVINNATPLMLMESTSGQKVTIDAASCQQTEFEFQVVPAHYTDGFQISIKDNAQNCTVTDASGVYTGFPNVAAKIQCPDEAGTRYSGNPVVRDQYVADPTAITVGDYLYVYAGKDETSLFDIESERCGNLVGCALEMLELNGGFDITGYHVYRTNNMVDWEYVAPALQVDDVPWMPQSWAGHVIEHDSKYYLYTSTPVYEINYVGYVLDFFKFLKLPNGPRASVGVAVSDTPEGPFVDIGQPLIKWGTPGTINSVMDPAAFVDDDGRAYLFYGGGGKAQYVELNDNMVSHDGNFKDIVGVNGSNPIPDFVEGVYIHKRGDRYYMSYSKSSFGKDPDGLAYATADNIDGPWTFQGEFLDDVGIMTNHSAIVNFKGEDYLLYHNGRLPGIHSKHDVAGDGMKSLATRALAVEKLSYDSNGNINYVEQTELGVPARP